MKTYKIQHNRQNLKLLQTSKELHETVQHAVKLHNTFSNTRKHFTTIHNLTQRNHNFEQNRQLYTTAQLYTILYSFLHKLYKHKAIQNYEYTTELNNFTKIYNFGTTLQHFTALYTTFTHILKNYSNIVQNLTKL